ncbi:unnamed protein product, partial [Iphiclides podalirius]
MSERAWQVTQNFSGLQQIYTDFDDWLSRFSDHIRSKSTNVSNETEVYINQTGLRIKTKGKKDSLIKEDGDFLISPAISTNIKITIDSTDNKQNKSKRLKSSDEYEEQSNIDYFMYKILASNVAQALADIFWSRWTTGTRDYEYSVAIAVEMFTTDYVCVVVHEYSVNVRRLRHSSEDLSNQDQDHDIILANARERSGPVRGVETGRSCYASAENAAVARGAGTQCGGLT